MAVHPLPKIHIKGKEKSNPKCIFCNNKKVHKHSHYTSKIRDLPILGKSTFLHMKKQRYFCTKCKKTFINDFDFMAKGQRMSKRLFANILKELEKEYSFSSVARNVGVSTNTIIRIFDTIQYSKINLKNVKALVIDEFKGNTDSEKYNVILTDIENKKVIDILPKRHFGMAMLFYTIFSRTRKS